MPAERHCWKQASLQTTTSYDGMESPGLFGGKTFFYILHTYNFSIVLVKELVVEKCFKRCTGNRMRTLLPGVTQIKGLFILS